MFLLQLDAPQLTVRRKPLQPENKKHIEDDDNCSIASSYPLHASYHILDAYVCVCVLYT